MSSQPVTFVTPEEYLATERKAERRSEYLNGQVFAMAGATLRHTRIVSSLNISLGGQLRNRDCEVLTQDMRLRVSPPGDYLYAYPDVVVVCGEPKLEDLQFDTLLNPKIIIEVLSRTTESMDRGPKFKLYRRIESLSEYLLVAQNEVHVEHYVRHSDGQWLLTEAAKLSDTIELPSVGASLKLADVYHRVNFEDASVSAL